MIHKATTPIAIPRARSDGSKTTQLHCTSRNNNAKQRKENTFTLM